MNIDQLNAIQIKGVASKLFKELRKGLEKWNWILACCPPNRDYDSCTEFELVGKHAKKPLEIRAKMHGAFHPSGMKSFSTQSFTLVVKKTQAEFGRDTIIANPCGRPNIDFDGVRTLLEFAASQEGRDLREGGQIKAQESEEQKRREAKDFVHQFNAVLG